MTAVLAIRNEEAYLANCLRHLVRNDVCFAIIDNGSSDASPEIYRRREFAANLVDVVDLPFRGAFSLVELLRHKMALVEAIETDWAIHVDADEVMHSYRPSESLHDALSRLAAGGWNAIDFDEFVFLPVDGDYVPDAPGDQPMSWYYFFQPHAPRLMRAWRKADGFSNVEHGGHVLSGPGLRLAPERLALRHYIVRTQAHAFEKYTTRTYAAEELAAGWHRARSGESVDAFRLPPRESLKRLADPAERALDRSEPWASHFWNARRAADRRTP